MPTNKPVLIISQSGRSIAASAKLAGIDSFVIDHFADIDTRMIALGVKKKLLNDVQSLDINVESLVDEYQKFGISGVIIGSGLEDKYEILFQLQNHFRLLGNNAETIRKIKDPAHFFPVLHKLGIDYPDISLTQPDNYKGWLSKRIGGCGGIHVKPVEAGVIKNCYFQKVVEGQSISAVFLAVKNRAILIGLNETWARNSEQGDFGYAGAVTLNLNDNFLNHRINEIINLVTMEYKLEGLCGLDCIIDKLNNIKVLEVNPRPTNTFELHENHTSLINLHIKVCLGKKVNFTPEKSQLIRGHLILYSKSNFNMPEFKWPVWTADRASVGHQIAKDEPICTIFAAASTQSNVRHKLKERKATLHKQLEMQRIAA